MKTSLSISIEEKDLEVIRRFCELTGMTVSRLYEEHTKGIVTAAKASGMLQKKSVTKLDLLKMFAKGAVS